MSSGTRGNTGWCNYSSIFTLKIFFGQFIPAAEPPLTPSVRQLLWDDLVWQQPAEQNHILQQLQYAHNQEVNYDRIGYVQKWTRRRRELPLRQKSNCLCSILSEANRTVPGLIHSYNIYFKQFHQYEYQWRYSLDLWDDLRKSLDKVPVQL